MADFPWEDFQTNSTATVEKGPWEDFATQKPKYKKTRAQVTAEVEKAQAARPVEQMSTLDKVADSAYWPAYVASKMDPVSAVLSAASPNNPDMLHMPSVSPEAVKEALKYSMIAPNRPDSAMAGVQNFTAGMVSGMSSPHGVAGLLSGGINRALPAATFIPPMVTSIPQTTEQLLQSENPAQATESGLNLLSSIVFPLLMAKHAEQPRTGQGAQPSDFGPYIIEPDVLPPAPPRYVPAGRQLGMAEPVTFDAAPLTQIPLTSASTLAERNNPQPFGQVIRSQEPVDPKTYRLGREQVQAMPQRAGGDWIGPEKQLPLVGEKTLAELNQPKPNVIEPVPGEGREIRQTPQPQDLRSIVRESVEEAMGRLISNEKRPSQESPVVLGGQQTQAPMVYGPRPVPLDVKVEPGRAYTPRQEVEGGKVSFAAPATGDTIPSARQSRVTELDQRPAEIEVPEARLATKQDQSAAPVEEYNYRLDPDAVSKMGATEFKEKMSGFTQDALTLGDRVKGNPEQIAKLEQQQAAATAEFKQAMQEGRMDDAMILSTKPQYFREALEIAKGTAPESAVKKLEQSKGMQVKQAQEKAAKQRGETGAIFPEGNEGRKPKKLSFEEQGKLISFYDQFSAKIEERAAAMAKVGAEWFKKAELKVGDVMYTPSGTPIKILDGYVRFPGKVKNGKTNYDYNRPMVRAEQVGPSKGSDEHVGTVTNFYLDGLTYDRPTLGSGINKAIDKNKESGSVINPFEGLRDKFKKKEEELRGDFALDGPRFLLDPKVSGFNNPAREVDSHQLWNRLKNKLNPSETEMYEKSGVAEKIRKLGKVTPERAAEMLQEGGERVETVSYGMEGKVSEAKREYARMTHEWYETMSPGARNTLDNESRPAISKEERERSLKIKGWSDEQVQKAHKYAELKNIVAKEPRDTSPRATSAYEGVSAFDTKEPMPEWTKSKEGKNVQRVDVVIPNSGKVHKSLIGETPDKELRAEGILWQPDNLHENLPNTLGWAMIQYKSGPKGERIAVVVEAQSRWGQEQHKYNQIVKENKASGMKRGIADYEDMSDSAHPLLKDYNRLILKAAIEQARKEGATHIMVSDAETAMMTEGHDAHSHTMRNEVGGLKEPVDESYITQAKGMRLHYDTILPKITEELTGVKGERVNLGKHKNAFDRLPDDQLEGALAPQTRAEAMEYADEAVGNGRYRLEGSEENGWTVIPLGQQRSNLIFRNPDGTPKTDVSGLMFSLDKVPTQKASLYEKDRPETRSTKLYGGAFFFDPDFWRDTFSKGKGGKQERVVGGIQKIPPQAEFIRRAKTPQGFGKLGKHVGGFLDPRAKAVGNEAAQGLIAWHAQNQFGASAASLWAESRKRLGDIVADPKDGMIELANGKRDFMEDVFRNEIAKPGSQPLTAEQKQALEFWKRVLRDTGMEQRAEGVKGFRENDETIDLTQPYFTRPAIGRDQGRTDAATARTNAKRAKSEKDAMPRREVGKDTGTTGTAIGADRYFQKGRLFPTERMGFEDGVNYEPSFLGRVAHYLKEHYRAIADERLAKHMEGLSTSEHRFMIDELTYHPAFRGRYFNSVAREVLKQSLDKPSHTAQKLSNVLQDYKKGVYALDVSYVTNQLLPSLFLNPKGFATAVVSSLKALGSDKVLSEFISKKENLQAAQEFVSYGGTLGSVWEFIGGSERKSFVDRIRPIKASGRAMSVGMDVAKIELYKAFKPLADKHGWDKAELVEMVGNLVFSSPSRSIGVTESRAMVERAFFNAPNYLRATANLLATVESIHKNTPSGMVARRALVGMSAAILIQFAAIYAGMVAMGLMDEDEMKDRLNPMKPQFLRVPIRIRQGKEGGLEGSADDKMVDVSYGNVFMSIARSVGSLGAIVAGEKEGKLIGRENPAVNFLSARLSPWLAVLDKIKTGKDYQGKEQETMQLIGEEMLPLMARPLMSEGLGSKAGWADVGLTTLGLATTMESRGGKQRRLEKEYAQLTYKAPLSKLNVTQRRNTTVKAEQALEGEEKEGPSLYSLEAPQKRAEKVMGLLSDESRAMLEQAGLKVPNIIATQTEDKKPLKLNKEEQSFYIETYAKELDRRLTNIKRSGSVVNKKRFEGITQSVGEFSWTQTKRLINTRARGELVK